MSRISLIAVTLVLTLPLGARALQEERSPAELEAIAELVVDAEVTSLEPRWAATRRGDIETVAWLAVERTHAGEPVETLALVLDGGALGDEGTWVPDEPVLVADGRYRLTLAHDDRGRWRVLGGPAGAVPLDPLPCYDLSGVSWAYQAQPVEEDFSLNVLTFPDEFVSDDLIEEAYLLSLEIWNVQGEAGVHIPYGGHTTDTQYGGGNNDVNVSMYESNTWGSTLAKTVYNYSGGTDTTDCDIEFYGANNNGTIPWTFDLENGAPPGTYDWVHTAVHEMGHCLGLSHSGYEAAIMYAYSSAGSGWEKRNLHFDDIDGLQAIYGGTTVQLDITSVELLAIEGDADAGFEPGDVFDLQLWFANQGNGWAIDVQGDAQLPGDELALGESQTGVGDVAPMAASGTEGDSMVFRVHVEDGCDGEGEVTIALAIEDAAGNTASTDIDALLACAEEPTDDDSGDDDDNADDDDGGLVDGSGDCSCSQGRPVAGAPAAALVALVALTMLALHRRRDRRLSR